VAGLFNDPDPGEVPGMQLFPNFTLYGRIITLFLLRAIKHFMLNRLLRKGDIKRGLVDELFQNKFMN